MRSGSGWLSPFTLLLLVSPQLATAQGVFRPPPASGSSSSPEEQLWQQISGLRTEPLATQPYAAWFDAMRRQREALLTKAQLYLTLYPGGAHRVEAVRLELATLFELGSLHGGAFDALCTRVQEYLRDDRADEPAAWEAAYWDIFCRRLKRGPSPTQPASGPSLEPDAELLAAYQDYVVRYPRSPYVPRMADALFDRAIQDRNEGAMQQLVETLRANFPDRAVTAALAAEWQREQTVGHPFWLTFEPPEGARVDTRQFIGHPVLIVVWAAADSRARRQVEHVEQFRRAHPEVQVVGVNLDMDRAALERTCRELGLDWPQFNDDLGPANRFAREWGVRRVPRIFAIDRDGRLVGSATDERWERWAIEALETGQFHRGKVRK